MAERISFKTKLGASRPKLGHQYSVTVELIAGGNGRGSRDGPAVESQLGNVQDLVLVENDSKVLGSDYGNGALFLLDIKTHNLSTMNTKAFNIIQPWGLFHHEKTTELIVSDSMYIGGQVNRVNSEKKTSESLSSKLSDPMGLDVNDKGDVFVCCEDGIYKMSSKKKHCLPERVLEFSGWWPIDIEFTSTHRAAISLCTVVPPFSSRVVIADFSSREQRTLLDVHDDIDHWMRLSYSKNDNHLFISLSKSNNIFKVNMANLELSRLALPEKHNNLGGICSNKKSVYVFDRSTFALLHIPRIQPIEKMPLIKSKHFEYPMKQWHPFPSPGRTRSCTVTGAGTSSKLSVVEIATGKKSRMAFDLIDRGEYEKQSKHQGEYFQQLFKSQRDELLHVRKENTRLVETIEKYETRLSEVEGELKAIKANTMEITKVDEIQQKLGSYAVSKKKLRDQGKQTKHLQRIAAMLAKDNAELKQTLEEQKKDFQSMIEGLSTQLVELSLQQKKDKEELQVLRKGILEAAVKLMGL